LDFGTGASQKNDVFLEGRNRRFPKKLRFVLTEGFYEKKKGQEQNVVFWKGNKQSQKNKKKHNKKEFDFIL
jgi:hypothetical protein